MDYHYYPNLNQPIYAFDQNSMKKKPPPYQV